MSYGMEGTQHQLLSQEIDQILSSPAPDTIIEMGPLLAKHPQAEAQAPKSWRGRLAAKLNSLPGKALDFGSEQTTRLAKYLYTFGPIKALTDFSIATADAFDSYVVRPAVWVGKKIHQAYGAASAVTKQDVDNFCEDTWIRTRAIGKGMAIGAAFGGLAGVGASFVFSPSTGASSLIASPFLVGLGAGVGAGLGGMRGSTEGNEAVARKRHERSQEAQKPHLRLEHQGPTPTGANGKHAVPNTPPPSYNFDFLSYHQPEEAVIV